MYIPEHQEKRDGPPGGGALDPAGGFLSERAPEHLQHAGDQEGDERQKNREWKTGIGQDPKNSHPQFDVPSAHPIACPGGKQKETRQPYIRTCREVGDHTRKDQWIGSPVRDAVSAQVIEAYRQKIKEQPGHWLRMI